MDMMIKYGDTSFSEKTLGDLNITGLDELYNKIAKELGEKELGKAKNKETAVKRTWAILNRWVEKPDDGQMEGGSKPDKATKKEKKDKPPRKPRQSKVDRTKTIKVVPGIEWPTRRNERAKERVELLKSFDGKTVEEFYQEEGKHPLQDTHKYWPKWEVLWALDRELIQLV